MIKAFEKRKRQWGQFEKWKSRQKPFRDPKKVLQLIGEWVDFFLLKYPRRSDAPNVCGIQKMHRALSHISFTK